MVLVVDQAAQPYVCVGTTQTDAIGHTQNLLKAQNFTFNHNPKFLIEILGISKICDNGFPSVHTHTHTHTHIHTPTISIQSVN